MIEENAYHLIEGPPGKFLLRIHGNLDIRNAADAIRKLSSALRSKQVAELTVDLKEAGYIDDYGVLALFELKRRMLQDQGRFEMVNLSDRHEPMFSQVHFDDCKKSSRLPRRPAPNMLIRLGSASFQIMDIFKLMVSFLGSVVISSLKAVRNPRSFRWSDTIAVMRKTGVDALPIVAMISFLLGLIISFMSALQLQQFGANIYVASLVSIAMVSELGPIMTAIIVAGRTGSAFAAEIGTMKISDEIDALFVMGFDPTLFLVVPRMLATLIVVPLLTFFSDLFAIAGGLTIGVLMLDLTPGTFMSQSMAALSIFELGWATMKSAVFAVLIAWVGCLRGFRAQGGAAGVGNAATSAVVGGIFLIVLFDSIFAVIRSYM
ncbi:MAG: MlaE family lipid ABC transporter permease subunit [Desulfobacterales bacterium]|nr:MlaE family lipid ABC transporter permease subunit [Desulfobacterales bacterium]MDD3951217.1 MlaE family lipid ABC transporter permease subunit [Desulfobacterales bacterium]